MQRKKIGLGQQLLEADEGHAMLLGEGVIGERLIRQQLHAETLAAQGDRFANASEASDAERSPAQGEVGLARPLESAGAQMLRDQVLGDRQD